LREHEPAWIYGRCLSRAGFYGHDPRVCIRAHGNADDISRRNTAALRKHSHDAILSIARAADGDFFTFKIGGVLDARVGNEIKGHLVRLKHNSFDGCAL
jgi:hypothetical protein